MESLHLVTLLNTYHKPTSGFTQDKYSASFKGYLFYFYFLTDIYFLITLLFFFILLYIYIYVIYVYIYIYTHILYIEDIDDLVIYLFIH